MWWTHLSTCSFLKPPFTGTAINKQAEIWTGKSGERERPFCLAGCSQGQDFWQKNAMWLVSALHPALQARCALIIWSCCHYTGLGLSLMGTKLWQACAFRAAPCCPTAPRYTSLLQKVGAHPWGCSPAWGWACDMSTWLNHRCSTLIDTCLSYLHSSKHSVTFSLLIHYSKPVPVIQISLVIYFSVKEACVWSTGTVRRASLLWHRCHRSKLRFHCKSRGN